MAFDTSGALRRFTRQRNRPAGRRLTIQRPCNSCRRARSTRPDCITTTVQPGRNFWRLPPAPTVPARARLVRVRESNPFQEGGAVCRRYRLPSQRSVERNLVVNAVPAGEEAGAPGCFHIHRANWDAGA